MRPALHTLFASLSLLALGACRARVTQGDQCSYTSDCAESLVCASGLCRAACSTDRDCPASNHCLASHVCQLPPTEAGVVDCEQNTDCTNNRLCRLNHCVQQCVDSTECASGTVCQSNLCMLADAGAPEASFVDTVDAADVVDAMDAPVDAGVRYPTAIHLGLNHSCALLNDQSVWCWGDNSRGQVGNGAMGGDVTTPVRVFPVSGAMGVRRLAAAGNRTCVTDTGGQLFCWGENSHGQSGGDAGSYVSPTMVLPANVTYYELSPTHTCVLESAAAANCAAGTPNFGALSCFGANDHFECQPSTTNPLVAVSERSPPNVPDAGFNGLYDQVAAGQGFTYRRRWVDNSHLVFESWGDNDAGMLGLGDRSTHLFPTQLSVPTSGSASQIAASPTGSSVCARFATPALTPSGCPTGSTMNSEAWCYGDVSSGALPMSGTGAVTAPSHVAALDGLNQLGLGLSHGCAMVPDPAASNRFTPLCWGQNNVGQRGAPSADAAALPGTSRPTLVVNSGTAAFVSLAVGGGHNCVLAAPLSAPTGPAALFCWGDNAHGQLGSGPAGIAMPLGTEVVFPGP